MGCIGECKEIRRGLGAVRIMNYGEFKDAENNFRRVYRKHFSVDEYIKEIYNKGLPVLMKFRAADARSI